VADPPEAQASAAAWARGEETILLVEDEEEVRQLVSEILTACGYTVLGTGNPLEALEISERHRGPLHLLLTDMVMPVMRGPAVAARVLGCHPATRVLYMSGYTESMVNSQGIVEPAGVFLQKPLTPDVLARTVREVLDTVSPRLPLCEAARGSSVGARSAPHRDDPASSRRRP
jgi:two-component system cell cycle sensor histidine kinase/response regulator CckA